MEERLLQELYKIITPEKAVKFEKFAAERTAYITVIVENIFQEHNASAVTRTCDCFGIRDLHIIEKNNKYTVNKDIALGSGRWVNHYHYNDPSFPTTKCIEELKIRGYKIAATTPHTNNYTIHDVPIDKPIALLFGTEYMGLSEKALDLSDYLIKIPMLGFTESLNISVSAALAIFTIRERLNKQSELTGLNWKLSKDEQTKLKIKWCKNLMKNPDFIIKELTDRIKESKI